MVYIHVPYCRRKCLYCDFYSKGEPRNPLAWSDYVSSIIDEAQTRCSEIPHPVRTLYIGGGTPSLVPPDELERMVGGIRPLCDNFQDLLEFTLEANPDDITPQKAEAWRRMGINRISVGVQSLVDEELCAAGRRHDSRQAIEAANLLSQYFENISLDLIFGLPGQTLDSLNHSISGILSMKPKHISVYNLMYEDGTPLTRMRDRGLISETPEDVVVAMFDSICSRLAAAGYEHYEISNFALPGYRSKHNSAYWTGVPYIGLGVGAHSFDGKCTRRANRPEGTVFSETLDDTELREEMVMTRLRTCEGIDLDAFRLRFGEHQLQALLSAAKPFLEKGHLKRSGNRLHLTRSGIMISDSIILDLA